MWLYVAVCACVMLCALVLGSVRLCWVLCACVILCALVLFCLVLGCVRYYYFICGCVSVLLCVQLYAAVWCVQVLDGPAATKKGRVPGSIIFLT